MAFNRRHRPKVCRFCSNDDLSPNYKNPDILAQFLSERAKIIPARITGTCAKHQRVLAREIKRARNVALMPFTRLP